MTAPCTGADCSASLSSSLLAGQKRPNFWNEFRRDGHERNVLALARRLDVGKLFVLGLTFVTRDQLLDAFSRSIQGGISAFSFRLPPLSSTERFLGLVVQFVCSNHEYALRILVRHVEDLQVAAGYSLADLPARVSGRPQVFTTAAQDLFNFLFGDAVVVNVWLAGV